MDQWIWEGMLIRGSPPPGQTCTSCSAKVSGCIGSAKQRGSMLPRTVVIGNHAADRGGQLDDAVGGSPYCASLVAGAPCEGTDQVDEPGSGNALGWSWPLAQLQSGSIGPSLARADAARANPDGAGKLFLKHVSELTGAAQNLWLDTRRPSTSTACKLQRDRERGGAGRQTDLAARTRILTAYAYVQPARRSGCRPSKRKAGFSPCQVNPYCRAHLTRATPASTVRQWNKGTEL